MTAIGKKLALVLGIVLASAAIFQFVDVFLNAYRSQRLPKNFAVVAPGILMRSGQMRPEHLREVFREHGVRTVVCLNPGDYRPEEAIAREMGVDYVEFGMPGDGQGDPALFHRYLEIVGDRSRRPVLVHCAAGAYRTGVAVALYRMLYEGWTAEDAMNEMRFYGCKIDGDRPLIEHLQKTFDSIPSSVRQRVHLADGKGARFWD